MLRAGISAQNVIDTLRAMYLIDGIEVDERSIPKVDYVRKLARALTLRVPRGV